MYIAAVLGLLNNVQLSFADKPSNYVVNEWKEGTSQIREWCEAVTGRPICTLFTQTKPYIR